jgi:DNA-binding XRE family transcriptional regulator
LNRLQAAHSRLLTADQNRTPRPLARSQTALFLTRMTPIVPNELSRDVSARFGLRLRQLRRERTLTQTRMATVFGIDRSFISDVERGRKSISLPTLEIIALGLNMTLSELLKDV